ncbi:MAG: DUF1993 family protein [Caulobacteraceae bacterium]
MWPTTRPPSPGPRLDRAFPAGALEAREDEPLTYEIGTGMVLTFPRGQWLTSFAATNLYFHLSTAYGILRARGCPIGEADLFAGGSDAKSTLFRVAGR